MRKSRFTESQIIGILKEVESGRTGQEVRREHGISEHTLYRWKKKYGGMEASDAKRLRELEEENRKLKAVPSRPNESTTAPSSPARRCSAGPRIRASSFTSSNRASRRRTRSSRASTPGFATNASTSTSSRTSTRRKPHSNNGDGTTTRSGLTACSKVKPQTNSPSDSLHEWTDFGGRSPHAIQAQDRRPTAWEQLRWALELAAILADHREHIVGMKKGLQDRASFLQPPLVVGG